MKNIMIGVAAGVLALAAAGAALGRGHQGRRGAVDDRAVQHQWARRARPARSSTCSSMATPSPASRSKIIVKDDASKPDVGQAARPGAHRQRQGRRCSMAGISPAALSIASLVDRGEDRDGGRDLRHLGGGRTLALHGAHELHARPVLGGDRRLGGEERRQEDRDPGRTISRPARKRRRRSRTSPPRAARRSSPRCACPCDNADFAPFLQRARDLNPDTLFAFVPNHQAEPAGEAVPRARHGQVRASASSATGDLTARRRAARHDRRHARRSSPRTIIRRVHDSPLNKDVRRGFREGERRPAPDLPLR